MISHLTECNMSENGSHKGNSIMQYKLPLRGNLADID